MVPAERVSTFAYRWKLLSGKRAFFLLPPNTMIPILIFLITLAWYVFAWYKDFSESQTKIYYGKSEGNKLYRGSGDGQMVPWKAIAVAVAVAGIGIGSVFAVNALRGETQGPEVGYYAAAGWYAVIGLAHYFLAYRPNAKRSKANRLKQIAYRDKLKAFIAQGGTVEQWVGSEVVGPGAGFGNKIETDRNGKSYHPLFQWLNVPSQGFSDSGIQATRMAIGARHFDWAAIPESHQKAQWGDLTFHPK